MRTPGQSGPVSREKPDLTRPIDLLAGQAETGPVRDRRPVYLDLLPPCNVGCPAGENIQAWLAHVEAGRPEQAWRQLVADNPMPAICGRVCYHPCESACNRASLDSPVSIHVVERFLGDLALDREWTFDSPVARTGRRILVVGGGPSGLSAAYHLARRGHEVEIRDAGAQMGGMMRYGIPAYRLPRDGLDCEIARIADLGVRMTCGHRVDDLDAERREGAFDAVYGGGNTAMDAARVARRLGADDTLIIYRRTRAQMSAHAEEAEDAEREGVKINWLRTITAFDGPDLTVEQMELDAAGVPYPTGRFETLAADTVILALGQETDTAFLRRVPGVEMGGDGTVSVSASMMTGCPGVFAGGDMVPSERTVTVGIGHGKKAAANIDAWLRGVPAASRDKPPVVAFGQLNLWYFGDAAQRQQPQVPAGQAAAGFDEVLGGLPVRDAVYEAARCLSCGNCCECDGCLGACPEGAVIKLGTGHRYEFDYSRCTGCGVCYEQCPVHAIEMITTEPTTELLTTGRE